MNQLFVNDNSSVLTLSGIMADQAPAPLERPGARPVPRGGTDVFDLTDALPEFTMRAPCSKCGDEKGYLRKTGGQNTVRCAGCNHFCYNAPKVETGEAVATLTSRPGIKPSLRNRVLERDRNACAECGRFPPEVRLEVGHLLSVEEGTRAGFTIRELYDFNNLYAVCAECNSGRSERSVDPRFWLALMHRRLRTE